MKWIATITLLTLSISLVGCQSARPQRVTKYGKPAMKVKMEAYIFANGVLVEAWDYKKGEKAQIFMANPVLVEGKFNENRTL